MNSRGQTAIWDKLKILKMHSKANQIQEQTFTKISSQDSQMGLGKPLYVALLKRHHPRVDLNDPETALVCTAGLMLLAPMVRDF